MKKKSYSQSVSLTGYLVFPFSVVPETVVQEVTRTGWFAQQLFLLMGCAKHKSSPFYAFKRENENLLHFTHPLLKEDFEFFLSLLTEFKVLSKVCSCGACFANTGVK